MAPPGRNPNYKRPRQNNNKKKQQSNKRQRYQTAMAPYGRPTYVKSALGEKKFVDTGDITQPVYSGGSHIQLLNGVAYGSDYNQRVGRVAMFKNFNLKFWMVKNGSSLNESLPPYQVRWMLVLDQQPNKTVFSPTDLLVTNTVRSQLNLNYRNRFRVLWDKVFNIGGHVVNEGIDVSTPFTAWATGNDYAGGKKFKKFTITTEYADVDATIGSISTNAIYLVVVSDGASASDLQPYITYNCRLRFYDP